MTHLKDTIAVVTGASRGAGKGIALALGAAGATVYVTGRSTRAGGSTRDFPGTIEETAAAVTEAGGRGIALRCDHTVEAEVQALFARIRDEQGGLDLLVNNAWGGHDVPIDFFPFWELSLTYWDTMFHGGVRSAIISSKHGAPLLMARGKGLMINTTAYDDGRYTQHLFYDMAKNALNRLAFDVATELKPHGVAALALAPGWMRTELVLKAFHTDEAHWQEVPDLATTETPAYLGRAVVALASDPQVMSKTGRTLKVADLAREYDFTDADGRQPPPFRMPEVIEPDKHRV